MARVDWSSMRAWDDAARREFDARIKRSPKGWSRAGRFCEVARSLFFAGDDRRRRAALALLERGLVEAECSEHSHRAQLLDDLGRYHLMLDEPAAALRWLRESAADRRVAHHSPTTEELLARCLVAAGDFDGARAALAQHHRLPDAAELEATDIADVTGAPYRDPDAAAEAIVVYYHAAEPPEPAVPEVFAADRGSLAALDRHFQLTPEGQDDAEELGMPRVSLDREYAPRYAFTRELLPRIAVELGAYLGRVLVRTAGGRWRAKTPIAKSRIALGRREVDPFAAAIDAIEHELPLVAVFDQLAGTR